MTGAANSYREQMRFHMAHDLGTPPKNAPTPQMIKTIP